MVTIQDFYFTDGASEGLRRQVTYPSIQIYSRPKEPLEYRLYNSYMDFLPIMGNYIKKNMLNLYIVGKEMFSAVHHGTSKYSIGSIYSLSVWSRGWGCGPNSLKFSI